MYNLFSYKLFVPILTTQAGSCLTMQNWQQAGVNALACELDSLIVKPGISVLKTFTNLRSYLAWPGTIFLYVNLQVSGPHATYLIRSPYDGQKIQLMQAELFALIMHLQPDYVVFSVDMYSVAEMFMQYAAVFPTPVNQAILHAMSNKPADDAFHGLIYSHDEVFSLLAPASQYSFVPLDRCCSCAICSAGYTRAYLHHLLQHTPLLARRLLILHNIYFVAHAAHVSQYI
jgi:queuine tRNA-ribosyltransferase